MEAFCVKCKEKRKMKDAKVVILKNNRPAIQGACSECGTKMYKMGTT